MTIFVVYIPRREVNILKNFMKYVSVASMCSFVLAVASVMVIDCVGLFHEPEMPEELKK